MRHSKPKDPRQQLTENLAELSQRLDEQLEAALSRAGLTPAAIAALPDIAATIDPQKAEAVKAAFEPELPAWDLGDRALSRPPLASVPSRGLGPMLRC